MDTAEKVRENAVRRKALRLGLALRKSRARSWSLHNQCEYMLIDASLNAVVVGGDFDWSLAEITEWLDDYEARLRAGGD